MRFSVFSGETYHPEGGWKDFKGGADTLDACRDILVAQQRDGCWSMDWFQVVDHHTGDLNYKAASRYLENYTRKVWSAEDNWEWLDGVKFDLTVSLPPELLLTDADLMP